MMKGLMLVCKYRLGGDPHHGGNWKFQRGGEVKSPGSSRGMEGGRVDSQINFQMVQFDSVPT